MYVKHLKTTNAFKGNCVSLMAQFIQSPNLVFGLTIHSDSKLLHYLFICSANSYYTILLYFILKSALFDTSVPTISVIIC